MWSPQGVPRTESELSKWHYYEQDEWTKKQKEIVDPYSTITSTKSDFSLF